MTIIRRISKLNHPGTLHDFTWPADLADFGRYNLVYGWNGSGKTTISRLFRSLEKREEPADCKEAILSTAGQQLRASDFSHTTLLIRVFNRDFIAESVFPTGGGDMPLILVLGKGNVEKQKTLERLKAHLSEAVRRVRASDGKRVAAERGLDAYCSEHAKLIKDTLRSPDQRFTRIVVETTACRIACQNHFLCTLLEFRLIAEHQAQQQPKINALTYQLPSLSTHVRGVSQLLGMTVASTAIQSLMYDHKVSSWVYEGLGLHQSDNTASCLFCEQTLPDGRLQKLKAHFNDKYEQFINELDKQIGVLHKAREDAENIRLPHKAQFYASLTGKYDASRRLFDQALTIGKDTLASLAEELIKKKGLAFHTCTLNVPVPRVRPGIVEGLNGVINEHNAICERFASQVAQARKRLEADLVAVSIRDFGRLKGGFKNV